MAVSKEIKARVTQLRETILKYRAEYHERDTSSISPEALDSLKHELVELERAYPMLVTATSPTQVVAGTVLPELKKVRHEVPQWSLDDAFTEAEVYAFDERVRRALVKRGDTAVNLSYEAEHKIDGLHIVLTYTAGKLTMAATRGDGVVGEEVTHNIRTIRSVPHTLTRPVSLIAEGEVFMSRAGFKTLNETQRAAGKQEFANPRNAAAGSVRQLDSNIAAQRPLGVYVYDINRSSEVLPDTQSGELTYLKELGLPVNPHSKQMDSIDELVMYWKHWQEKRDTVDYLFDGVVVKVESRTQQEALGHTGKGPRYAIAFKFPAEQVTTVIEDIGLQVGRTGKLTPVAHLRPVSVSGSTVARATLHNEDFIRDKDIRIGDTVILQKAGDIIPEIVQVLLEFRPEHARPWKFPKRSELCGGEGLIERVPGESAHRCVVTGSYTVQARKLAHFVGKGALDIVGFGKKTVELLMKHELLSSFDDIFDLTIDEVLKLPGFKQTSAENLIRAIQDAKKVSFDRFLIGLSIDHVGEETAHLLAVAFQDCEKLQHASVEDIATINGIGPIVAKSVASWFTNTENALLLKRLLVHVSLQTVAPPVVTGPFAGMTVVVTGTLETLSREEAETLVRRAGGSVAGSVSKKTSYVLAGENAGSKLTKARSLGVAILSETAFRARLGL